MRVPAIVYASESLIAEMDQKVFDQVTNVATLPGIVRASHAMPDAHWGYGFPIGGVAAFDAEAGGIVSAGGVGFDVSCGVRTHLTHLTREQVVAVQQELAAALYAHVPVGVGSEGEIALDAQETTAMLTGGARWAIERGFGRVEDLERIEEGECVSVADPVAVSEHARKRQRREMGTLGSGNHYLEVQEFAEIFASKIAAAYGLEEGKCVVTVHCGSRGVGHQIGTEFLREMAVSAPSYGIVLPDREITAHLARQVCASFFKDGELPLMFDVSHNTCKLEIHKVDGEPRELFVHGKGATRAFGPGHPGLPEVLLLHLASRC